MRFPANNCCTERGSAALRFLIFCALVGAVVSLILSQPVLTEWLDIPVRIGPPDESALLLAAEKPAQAGLALSSPEKGFRDSPDATLNHERASGTQKRKYKAKPRWATLVSPSPQPNLKPKHSPAPRSAPTASPTPTPTRAPAPSPTATPSPAPTAVPTPTPAAAPEEAIFVEPTPKPVPSPPPLRPLDMATLAREPEWWPGTVALTKTTVIPVVLGGRDAGKVEMPAGRELRVIRVIGRQVELEYQSNRHIVPFDSTDILPRANRLRNAKAALTSPSARSLE